MGTSVQGHRSLGPTQDPVLKEILETNPKDCYWNAFKLSNKFLGKTHFLTQRLHFSHQKAEMDFTSDAETVSSKKVSTLGGTSDLEGDLFMTDRSLKIFGKANEEESPLMDEIQQQDNRNYVDTNGVHLPRNIRIRDNSLTKILKSKQSLERTTSKTSLDGTLGPFAPDDMNNHRGGNRFALKLNTGNQGKGSKSHRRYKSTNNEYQDNYKREEMPMNFPTSSSTRHMMTCNHNTELYLQMILGRQKDLEYKVSQLSKQKANLPTIRGGDNSSRSSHRAIEDAKKIEELQKEVESLKATFRDLETKNQELKELKNTKPSTPKPSTPKQSSFSPRPFQAYQPNQQGNLTSKFKGPVVNAFANNEQLQAPPRRSNSDIEHIEAPPAEKEKLKSPEPIQKRDSLMMVLPIPTSIETLDSPILNASNNSDSNKMLKYAIIRKKIYGDDGCEYLLVCKATWTKKMKQFTLELVKKAKDASEQDEIVHKKGLQYKNLQTILKQVEYKDVLPINFQVKEIRNFYTLIKFLLMPFTSVRIMFLLFYNIFF